MTAIIKSGIPAKGLTGDSDVNRPTSGELVIGIVIRSNTQKIQEILSIGFVKRPNLLVNGIINLDPDTLTLTLDQFSQQ